MSEPHLPPKRPYDSLFTPRQAPPAVPIASASRRPYDSLFTPGAERGVPPPPQLLAASVEPTIGSTKIASYIPVFLLLWKGTEWTMNEIMVYNHPAFVPGRDGRLKYGGQASLFGTVGLAQEADGGISFARLKWAFNGANVIAASERTRRDLAAWPVLGWFEDMTAYFLFKALPGPLAAGLTPFAKRPWDEPEPCDK